MASAAVGVPAGTWRRLAVLFPPHRLRLPHCEVHVWRLDLNVPATQVSQLNQTLDDDERARGARLVFYQDRSRFIAAHGFVRRLLGSYLGLTPEAVRYDIAPRGKPQVRAVRRDAVVPLRFNVSSSDDTALLAVSLDREVGVDIEKIRPRRDCLGIAERFFSPRETSALRRLGDQEQTSAFYRCWVQKEAYVKATGQGMFLPLDSFAVPVGPPDLPAVPERPQPVSSSAAEVGLRRWTMIGVPEIAGFAAAVVVESSEVNSAHPVPEQPPPAVRCSYSWWVT